MSSSFSSINTIPREVVKPTNSIRSNIGKYCAFVAITTIVIIMNINSNTKNKILSFIVLMFLKKIGTHLTKFTIS